VAPSFADATKGLQTFRPAPDRAALELTQAERTYRVPQRNAGEGTAQLQGHVQQHRG